MKVKVCIVERYYLVPIESDSPVKSADEFDSATVSHLVYKINNIRFIFFLSGCSSLCLLNLDFVCYEFAP